MLRFFGHFTVKIKVLRTHLISFSFCNIRGFYCCFYFWFVFVLMFSFLQLHSWVACYAWYTAMSQSQHWFCPIGYRAWSSEGQQCWFPWTSDCFWVCSYIEQIIKQITSICSDYKTFKHILNWMKTIHELCCEINGNNSWFLSYFTPPSLKAIKEIL